MDFHKKYKQFTKLLMSGILIPVLLLCTVNVQAAVPDSSRTVTAVVGSLDEQDFSEYDTGEVKFLFGGKGHLPFTYQVMTAESEFARMQSDSGFLYVEYDTPVIASAIRADDPFFTSNARNDEEQWYLPKIKIREAWEFGTGSRSTKVAIIDTGIHASHLELDDGRVLAGFDVLANRRIPARSDSDENGHGTAVAGVIGAIPNNEIGIAGINWDVGLVPVKALEADGTGRISSVAAGIVWAADNGADVINLSLGGQNFGNDQTLNNAIIYAYGQGVVIVAAAGNDQADEGINLDSTPFYPICADGGQNMVIGVLATDLNDKKADFSNFGVNCVDIAAPGRKILTTTYLPSDPSDSILIYGSGTSLAAPIVSGVAALLKSNNPDLTNAQIRDTILNTADNIDDLNQSSCFRSSCNGFLGEGRINALSALSPQPLLNGSLVRETDTGIVYLVSGGEKMTVSDFVFKQRGYFESQIINEMSGQLDEIPSAGPLVPLDGTLMKSPDNATVYVMHEGVKRALTFLVFQSRDFRFADVQIIPVRELAEIPESDWYWPPDGTMVLVKGDQTVYIMESGVKRPVTYFVFNQRRLSFARVVTVTQDEFNHIPVAPDEYWLPPVEGTLVKAQSDSTVYLIRDGIRRALDFEEFTERGLSFTDVKQLPDAEIEIIQAGLPL